LLSKNPESPSSRADVHAGPVLTSLVAFCHAGGNREKWAVSASLVERATPSLCKVLSLFHDLEKKRPGLANTLLTLSPKPQTQYTHDPESFDPNLLIF
jgi:hypothetical protein